MKKSELANLWAKHFDDSFPRGSYFFWKKFKPRAVSYAFDATAKKVRRNPHAFNSLQELAQYATAIMRDYDAENEERAELERTPVPRVKGEANQSAVKQRKSPQKRPKRITPKAALRILSSCYVPGHFNLKRLMPNPEASLRLKKLVGHIDESALASRLNKFLGIEQKKTTGNEEVILESIDEAQLTHSSPGEEGSTLTPSLPLESSEEKVAS